MLNISRFGMLKLWLHVEIHCTYMRFCVFVVFDFVTASYFVGKNTRENVAA